MSEKILFNEAPFLGVEAQYINDAIANKHISGDGKYTKFCNDILKETTGSSKVLLVNSGTSALEMAALLLGIKEGDEVICPSYTFATTASAFALRGAKLVFVDIRDDTLNLDETKIEAAITPKTKVIVPVHYAGVACEMEKILAIAKKYNVKVVEDAAQAVGASYNGRMCGSIGDIGCYSFHETKNFSSGEGGAIVINSAEYVDQAEIIREKGTNRSLFFRGQVDKYTWVDLGSSYLPSDINAAYLYPQLLQMKEITENRLAIWQKYDDVFKAYGNIQTPIIPDNCQHNAHMYYLRFDDLRLRTDFINYMKSQDIMCVFHYIPLHSSPAGKKYGRASGKMNITDHVSETLVRLPLYYGLKDTDQEKIITAVEQFLRRN